MNKAIAEIAFVIFPRMRKIIHFCKFSNHAGRHSKENLENTTLQRRHHRKCLSLMEKNFKKNVGIIASTYFKPATRHKYCTCLSLIFDIEDHQCYDSILHPYFLRVRYLWINGCIRNSQIGWVRGGLFEYLRFSPIFMYPWILALLVMLFYKSG